MSHYGNNIKEQEICNKLSQDLFSKFDCTRQLGNIDFCVAIKQTEQSLFDVVSLIWGEAKKGDKHNIYESFVQLILTIGKERSFEKYMPPKYLCALDAQKIAFVRYHQVRDVFFLNDFNWNVTPSNHDTKEFHQLYARVEDLLEADTLLFDFNRDWKELQAFIRQNLKSNEKETQKIRVNKNNFTFVYQKWVDQVKPTIAVEWDVVKKTGVIDADFFLADLISENDCSMKKELSVRLRTDYYQVKQGEDNLFSEATFNDKQKAYHQFWMHYERPPREEYRDYILGRHDLLVSQDVRERKGSYFTPQQWVEKSQEYLADVLGENWQDQYFIWDCCAGTGNMENGLTNKYNVWASTLDQPDVDVIHDRIKHGANLLPAHVFQFDFLNDSFDKLPESLRKVIDNEETRRKLVVYINPPYAEGDSRKGTKRSGVAVSSIQDKYSDFMKYAKREMYIQFLTRIYTELPEAYIANFSKLKNIQAPKFIDYRRHFLAKLEKVFLVPSDTFDNVDGDFPIGFFIWNTQIKEEFNGIISDVYNDKGISLNEKVLASYDGYKFMSPL